ncbi:hypothetical protein FEM48_Zijuj01G0074200 [Ziziphus jujuba var. spinosa]|uniref:Uncharacterized protein n=1 Tax=Ziziphus jujuba var. spinosa TaxID=714518 RepID=A0A978VZX0_ZIZJJ|nr:hypothetical protein FEM48_Zijuj01G0074200 [Ziziphus jujuba var. spinosa]
MDFPQPQTLLPCSSGRRTSTDSNSPEFEFWMVRNPSFPQPDLHSADELFVDGVILPLHLLPHQNPPTTSSDPPEPINSEPHLPDPEPEPGPGPQIIHAAAESSISSSLSSSLTASKRWRDIFKKSDQKKSTKTEQEDGGKEKEKKKERKSGNGVSSAAELNINIWPFSRSRSAGNACTRPKTMFGAPGSRKVNSAPCSRSNSAGESKSRKWPSSPGRPGVHLGRSSPVWQVRRGGSGGKSSEPVVRHSEKGHKKEASESRRSKTNGTASSAADGAGGATAKAKVLSLNVPMCIGYRNHLSCRSDESSSTALSVESTGAGAGNSHRSSSGGGDSGGVGRGVGVNSSSSSVGSGGNLFNLRSLFTRKVY